MREKLLTSFFVIVLLTLYSVAEAVAQSGMGADVIADFEGKNPVAANSTTHKASVTAVNDVPAGLGKFAVKTVVDDAAGAGSHFGTGFEIQALDCSDAAEIQFWIKTDIESVFNLQVHSAEDRVSAFRFSTVGSKPETWRQITAPVASFKVPRWSKGEADWKRINKLQVTAFGSGSYDGKYIILDQARSVRKPNQPSPGKRPVVAKTNTPVKRPVFNPSISYEKHVAPLLEKFCVDCHGPQKQENGIRVDHLDRDFLTGKDAETWHDILDALNTGEMPPKEKVQPDVGERQLLVDWVTHEMNRAAQIKRSTGGRGVLRRLTRYEYNNTMADLLGVRLDYAANLPTEPNSKDGFMNNGAALGMSSMQMEYYLRAAQLGLSKALVEGPEPRRYEHVGSVNVGRLAVKTPKPPHTLNIQPGSCFTTRLMEFPAEGPVRIRVKAHAVIPAGKGPPRMSVRLGIRADDYANLGAIGQDLDVTATENEPGIFEFTGRLEHYPELSHRSNFYFLLVTVHNVYDDGSDALDMMNLRTPQQEKLLNKPDPKQPWLVVESVEFVAPDYQMWPPQYHQSILGPNRSELQTPQQEAIDAEKVVERFMKRAYRRPATEQEVDLIMTFYHRVRPKCPTYVQAMRHALSMVLVSPQFLYLVEPITAGQATRELTGYEVASRLSYFLWSTMPDAKLFELASDGRLLDPDVMKAQVKRMLADAQAERFVAQFAEQWLDLSALDRVAVNPQFYPDFNDRLKPAMRSESQLFLAEILHHQLSALNFVDSDFTMLNERLAKHYGIEGVTGSRFTRVTLRPEHRRGGLLTHASMLLGNSTGEDSHPIKRAVWILERLLDDPPSPPPANVPALDLETPGFDQLTLKEQLKAHRQDTACISCHLKIDPWGIPLENYDATGLYRSEAIRLTAPHKGRSRSKVTRAPVDATDTMPDGQTIDGVQQLKDYILARKKDEFARAMVVKMTAYALGRSLEVSDDKEVQRLTSRFQKEGYRLDLLIEAIVSSELFLTR